MDHNKSDTLGKAIKSARKGMNLTQEQLGEAVDLTQRFILSIENGHKKPSFEKLYLLIRTLGVDANRIFYPEHAKGDAPLEHLNRLLSNFDDDEIKLITAIAVTLAENKTHTKP